MRIISGKYKSKKIDTINSNDTRPTTDKVRENIFNILGNVDGDVLDLFAGSGSLGVESLSRGARRAMFIDGAKDAIQIIRKNTAFVEEPVEIFRNDFKRALKAMAKRQKSFDIIFLDPPYHKGLIPIALDLIDELSILKDEGTIIVELHKDETFNTNYEVVKTAIYGTVKVMVLK